MKKFAFLLAATFCGLNLFPVNSILADSAPNFLGTSAPSGSPDKPRQAGLKFLTTLDFPPFSFLDSNGRLNGYNVYLAKLICAELTQETNCTIQSMPWRDLESSLESGTGNAIISGIAATAESRRKFAFSKPYLRMPASFISLVSPTRQVDVDKASKGIKIGVIAPSAYKDMAQSFFPETSITGFASEELMQSELKAGKIDLVFGDALQSAFWLSSEDGRGCCRFEGQPYYSEAFLGEGMRIALSLNNPSLKAQIDDALGALQRKGKLEELYLRFFPVGFY